MTTTQKAPRKAFNNFKTPKIVIAAYLMIDHKAGRTYACIKTTDEALSMPEASWIPISKMTYMQIALKVVTQIIERRVETERKYPTTGPINVNLYTNHLNVARAVTRAFIIARDVHFNGTDPLRELKKRGKDVDLYLPIINAIVALYGVCKGIQQAGFVGADATVEKLYRDARDDVKRLGVNVKPVEETARL